MNWLNNFISSNSRMDLIATTPRRMPMAFYVPGPGIPDMPDFLVQRLRPENISRLNKKELKKVKRRLRAIIKEADRLWMTQIFPHKTDIFPVDLRGYTACVGMSLLIYRLCTERGYPCRLVCCMVAVKSMFSNKIIGYNKHMFACSCGWALDPMSNNMSPKPMTRHTVQCYKISDFVLSEDGWFGVARHPWLTHFGLTEEEIRTSKNILR